MYLNSSTSFYQNGNFHAVTLKKKKKKLEPITY